MQDNEIRDLLERSIPPVPALRTTIDELVAEGRRQHRRRRLTAAVSAATLATVVGLGVYAGSGLLPNAQEIGFAGEPDATSSAPASTGHPSAAKGRTDPKPTTSPDAPTPSGPDGNPSAKDDLGSSRTSFVDVVAEHLGSQHFKPHDASDIPTRAIVTGDWVDGDRVGGVTIEVTDLPKGNADYLNEAKGPDGTFCAVRPNKSSAATYRWDHCTTETLKDGSILRSASGGDSVAQTRGMSLIRKDRVAVSIAITTATVERTLPGDEPFEPQLTKLPLSWKQLREIVTDPRMIED